MKTKNRKYRADDHDVIEATYNINIAIIDIQNDLLSNIIYEVFIAM